MHAKSIVLADGVFAVQTNFSDKPLSVPAEKVVSVSTSKAERETLRRRNIPSRSACRSPSSPWN